MKSFKEWINENWNQQVQSMFGGMTSGFQDNLAKKMDEYVARIKAGTETVQSIMSWLPKSYMEPFRQAMARAGMADQLPDQPQTFDQQYPKGVQKGNVFFGTPSQYLRHVRGEQ